MPYKSKERRRQLAREYYRARKKARAPRPKAAKAKPACAQCGKAYLPRDNGSPYPDLCGRCRGDRRCVVCREYVPRGHGGSRYCVPCQDMIAGLPIVHTSQRLPPESEHCGRMVLVYAARARAGLPLFQEAS